MKKIKSIYVREIGDLRSGEVTREYYFGKPFFTSNPPITYNSKTNTYHQVNTEYKGEHIISVTYE